MSLQKKLEFEAKSSDESLLITINPSYVSLRQRSSCSFSVNITASKEVIATAPTSVVLTGKVTDFDEVYV